MCVFGGKYLLMLCLHCINSSFVFIEMGSKKEQGMHFNIYIILPHIRNTSLCYIFHLMVIQYCFESAAVKLIPNRGQYITVLSCSDA